MKYLCLISADRVMEDFSDAEAAEHFQEYAAFTQEIKDSGQFVAANRLKPRETAVTVRVRGGKSHVVDGPFAETKEQIGGYYLIDATDLNEAIRVAARIPGARYGSVEVRPIADDVQTQTLGFD